MKIALLVRCLVTRRIKPTRRLLSTISFCEKENNLDQHRNAQRLHITIDENATSISVVSCDLRNSKVTDCPWITRHNAKHNTKESVVVAFLVMQKN